MADVSWVPPWAEGKIEASHTVFDPSDPEQKIVGRCVLCGDTFQHTCNSGQARSWITRFAVVHRQLHPW